LPSCCREAQSARGVDAIGAMRAMVQLSVKYPTPGAAAFRTPKVGDGWT
jgi:hypothetical protein